MKSTFLNRPMRFQFPMNCDDENVAKCLGLEIARILLDSSFRDFAIARYESETRRIQESRRYFRRVFPHLDLNRPVYLFSLKLECGME